MQQWQQNPPSEALFVTGLPKDTMNDFCRSIFGQFGIVKDVNVLPVLAGKEFAAAIVTMSSVEDATWVVEHVNGNVPQGLASPVTVQFAEPRGKGKGKGGMGGMGGMKGGPPQDMMGMVQMLASALGLGGMGGMGKGYGKGGGYGGGKGKGALPPTGSVLRVQGIPFSATEEELKGFFAGYALSGRLAFKQDPATGRPSGVAFVEFVSAEEAKRAYTERNKQHLGNRYLELMEAFDRDIDMYLGGGGGVYANAALKY